MSLVLPIYNSSNEPFHNLVLNKPTYESSVMSLSDKISGDVYYIDNSLVCSMHEYVVYNGVQFTLVNPPTIVREGLVVDNSDLKGMTKYSFEFYHPMVMLSDFPFTDVAVSADELRYKSQDKKFTWVGYVEDYINKLNKNLQGTQWVCELSENTSEDILGKFSDVLSFNDNTIADALKTAYDTWGVPYIIDILDVTDARYSQGKRFLIFFGEPSNEIYASAEDLAQENPFVFQFGQGVGLKNNSVTPKNNKIVTRIAAYGSERNVPFGYPQIVWTGNQEWDFTINNDSTDPLSYPIYKGIVGGQWVKLIKHPFTRSHLMPTIYVETVNKKVNPNNVNYDPTTTIVDYHDALDGTIYPHTINPLAPSYEIHEFEDIFPELGIKHIVNAFPINDDETVADGWVDDLNDNGDYKQGYFKITLPVLDFDVYACAAITQEMQINMRSGACIGCTFDVQVDWELYKLNFYDSNGNFAPNGSQRDTTKFPNSSTTQVTLICKKDISTFGIIKPNVYQYPIGESQDYDGDEFVILGISLPLAYIVNAQTRLDEAMDKYMLENNVYYYEYPLKFDEYFLVNHPYILDQIKNNTIVRFGYNNNVIPLYIKQIAIKYGEKPLPEYNITLTDNIEVTLNQIGQANEAIGKMAIKVNALSATLGKGIDVDLSSKLSRVSNDIANGVITFAQGLNAGEFLEDSSGFGVFQNNDGNWVVEADYFNVRKKLQAENVEIFHSSHMGGRILATGASMTISRIGDSSGLSYVRCYFRAEDNNGNVIYNMWKVGDFAYCETFNLSQYDDEEGTITQGNHFYWRKVVGVSSTMTNGEHYIDLSKVSGEYASGSDAPMVGDQVILLGSTALLDPSGEEGEEVPEEEDTERQNAIILAGAGTGNPFIRVYSGINTFTLPTPSVQISPYGSWITVKDKNNQDARIDQLVNSLQDQIEEVQEQDDRQIVIWYGNVVPKLSNEPAVNWTTNQIKHEHVGDIYYNRSNKKAYSFEETITNSVASYAWVNSDNALLKTIELSASAQDTADGKKRVFVARPTQAQPYDIGDLWVNASFPDPRDGDVVINNVTYNSSNLLYDNDVLRCVTAKTSGSAFNISHWQPVQHYTTSRITQTSNQIKLEVVSGLTSTGIDITEGKIELNALNTVISDTLSVKKLETMPDTSIDQNNQARIEAHGSEMNVFGANGVVNIKFGVDENGYAVLKYYDRDGTFLYDLGPNGLNFIDVSAASMTAEHYVYMSNGLPDHSESSQGQDILYWFKPKRIAGMIKGDSNYTANNDAIAAQASGKCFTTTVIVVGEQGSEVLDTTAYASGLWRKVGQESVISELDEIDVYGSVDGAKEYLIMTTEITQSEANSFDWSLDEMAVFPRLKYTIYWQEYTYFINGVAYPRMYVWQDEVPKD